MISIIVEVSIFLATLLLLAYGVLLMALSFTVEGKMALYQRLMSLAILAFFIGLVKYR